ncbi:MAG: hypothetical protein MK101_02255 [Phycisphaerales bacterium]|nr:hypothetical protein [Phycisphaerales bacterium]
MTPTTTIDSLRQALLAVLNRLSQALHDVDDQVLAQAASEHGGGAIGPHVRHCLDHVEAVLIAIEREELVAYDRRKRGTDDEACAEAARCRLEQITNRLHQLPDEDRALEVEVAVDAAGTDVQCGSTLSRELAFVLSHTIHHEALIALALQRAQQPVPEGFGLAPATVRALSAS